MRCERAWLLRSCGGPRPCTRVSRPANASSRDRPVTSRTEESTSHRV
jgi:hypothetical protein